MNVLSLFDGMSCGQIALNRAGIKYDKYFACEIDKHAIQVTQSNYPDTIQLGDVTKVNGSDLPKIDLLMGGSPCQGFSFAGKQLAFDDPRSVLFFEYVRLLKECKPKWFLLENVKMKKEHESVITEYLGISPIEINSSLVSAQNRVRLYWTNIGAEPDGLFGELTCMIPQPKDKGILLKDILEPEVDEKYYLKNPKIDFSGLDLGGKGNCLRSSGHASQSKKHNFDLVCVASKGRNPENPKSRESGLPTIQMAEPRLDGKTNCLTSVGKDNLIAHLKLGRTEEGKQIRKENQRNGKDYTPFQAKEVTGLEFDKMSTITTSHTNYNLIFTRNYIQWDTSGKGYKSQQDRAFYENGKSGCIPAHQGENKNNVLIKNRIRRLTPVECERLQTVPDNYTSYASNSQRYRMLGNGWTVDVIAHIFNYLK